jgi:hypothetical protein
MTEQKLKPEHPEHSDRDWTEDFPHENGNYVCHCVHCGENFYGHKRRPLCRKCAMEVTTSDAPKQLTPEQEAVVKGVLNNSQGTAFSTVANGEWYYDVATVIAVALAILSDQNEEMERLRGELKADMRIMAMEWSPEKGLVLEAAHPIVQILANECANILDESNAPNFLTMSFRDKNTGKVFTLDVRRTEGETPSEQIQWLKVENTALTSEVERLREAARHCADTLEAYVEKENDPSLTAIDRRYVEEVRVLLPPEGGLIHG